MAEQLLPCPLCGAAFRMGQEPNDNGYVAEMFYIFHDYGPIGSAARSCIIDVPKHFETEREAITAWNTRHALEGFNPDAVRDVVEALQQADAALNSMAALVEAEWRDHDKAMTRHDNDVRAFRELRRNALARLGGAS